jgi:hypothetical protein
MIGMLGGGGVVVHPVNVPSLENHVVVEMAKQSKTEIRYPRPASQAKRRR